MKMNWYVLHVFTGSELEVQRQLREHNLTAIVIQETYVFRRGGKWHNQLHALFPGYVFVYMDYTPETHYIIKRIPGAIRLLPKEKPQPLPPEESARLVSGYTDDILPLSKVDFSGDSLRIIDGPLKEWEDYIVKIDRHRRRAHLRMPVLGESKDITLFIEPV